LVKNSGAGFSHLFLLAPDNIKQAMRTPLWLVFVFFLEEFNRISLDNRF